MNTDQLLARDSFIERSARSRATALLDAGSMVELVGPFDGITSPWLARQQIMVQADDGVVAAKGTFDGVATVVLAIEGAFQGGSMGEVGGAKIAAALELAAIDNRNGVPTQAVILFETGGVRLQEANLGLAAIAEIQAAIVDLRRYRPVIGVSAGTVGCYGGMSIAAGLCSYLVLTSEARLGLNGPQVIEQEAGVAEFDARNRTLIWSLTGGGQRAQSGLADACVADDTAVLRATVAGLFRAGVPGRHRSADVAHYLACLAHVDPRQPATAQQVQAVYRQDAPLALPASDDGARTGTGRGARWFAALAGAAPLQEGFGAALRVADATLAGSPARFIAVTPDPHNRYPRVRNGEIGLLEGWQLARAVHDAIAADAGRPDKRAIVAVVDVASQAYGRTEEAYGIHLALAAAAGAYAEARLAGHPVIGLIVGSAMSGAFLAHGYQANRLLAFDDDKVQVHAMGKASAARITLRSVEALEQLAASVPPMAYDLRNYASLGLLWRVESIANPDLPDTADVAQVRKALEAALADIRADPDTGLAGRLLAPHRQASRQVREAMRRQW